jgi:alpha-D-xyloside xylohydrolase
MSPFERDGDALVWRDGPERLCIEPWGADSLRVRATHNPAFRDLPAALGQPPLGRHVAPDIAIRPDGASLRAGRIRADITAAGQLSFSNAESGALLLTEPAPRFIQPPARWFRPVGGDLSQITVHFQANEGERFYGLGQHQHGLLDQKGCVIDLWHRNTEVSIPFLVSNRGYGLLWHNPAVGRVELGHNGTRWVAEASAQIDYWVTAGTYGEIMARYADATGHAPVLPQWAIGFWQSKLRYASQEELLSVAREYRRRGLPLDVIVIDFFHWTRMGEWRFDPAAWPDPAAMVAELDSMGVKVMVSVWPTLNPSAETYGEMERRGLLMRAERGQPVHMLFTDVAPGGSIGEAVHLRFYDATHPEARRFIWERVAEGYYRHGIQAFWLDACEPETYPPDHANFRYHLGNGLEVAGLYPLLHQQAFYEGMKAQGAPSSGGEADVVNLCRSAWAGSQRYGAAVWSGDIPSTFDALRKSVAAGLNIGLSGIPWWTTDIGGFAGGDPASPVFRELIVRWFQYGVFCPLFRLHGIREPAKGWGAGGPNEVWSFGDEAYEIIRGLLFLRQRMKPYLLAQMAQASATGAPPMRPLFFDFPDDPRGYEVEDEFMLGPDILVAPVVEQGAACRTVYLPAGSTWYDAWSGEGCAGGTRMSVAAPIERIPVFVRNQALLRWFAPDAGAPRAGE